VPYKGPGKIGVGRVLLAGVLIAVAAVLISASFGCKRVSREEEKLFYDAERHLAASDYATAIEKFSVFVDKYPDSQLAAASQYKTGYINYKFLKRPKDALKAYAVLLYVYPDSSYVINAREDRAAIFSDGDNHRQAVEEYIWLVKAGPESNAARYRFELANEYMGVGDFKQARIELDDLLKKRPSSEYTERAHFLIAMTYFMGGEYLEAANSFDYVMKKYAGQPVAMEAKLEKASSLIAGGYLGEAMKLLKELEKEYPNKSIVRIKMVAVEERMKSEIIAVPLPEGGNTQMKLRETD